MRAYAFHVQSVVSGAHEYHIYITHSGCLSSHHDYIKQDLTDRASGLEYLITLEQLPRLFKHINKIKEEEDGAPGYYF